MRLRQIEVFRAVMLSGSVSAAARMLHVSQPVVSRVLRHTELSVGFPLFERSRGRLAPTPEAHALYGQVKRAFAEIERVDALAANLRRGASGLLRIAATPSLAARMLPDALAAMRAAHPEVQCDLWAIHTRDIEDHLRAREIDCGIAIDPPERVAIASVVLAESELMLVAPRAWHPAGAVPTRRDLIDRPFITLSEATPLGDALGSLLEAAGWLVRPALRVQTYLLAGALVEKGLGYAFMDGFTAASLDPARVTALHLSPTVPVPLRLMRAADAAPSLLLGRLEQRITETARNQLADLADRAPGTPLALAAR